MRGPRFHAGRPRRDRTLAVVAAAAVASALSAGCVNLDDVTTVKDLRVLAVQADKPGFLVDLDAPGSAAAADLTATLTALVVDPKGNGAELTFSATGCPNYLDAITAASTTGTSLCLAPGTDGNLPDILRSVSIAPAASPIGPIVAYGNEYHPTLAPFGFTPEQIGAFFSLPAPDPTFANAIQYNRDFGIDALVNLTFTLGTEQATAVKHLVYWPKLDPAETPNQNPILDHLEFYGARDEVTGQPINRLDDMPTISLSAKDKLFVLPAPPPGQTWMDQSEIYPLRVRNGQTHEIETRMVQELMLFDFFTTAGTFGPAERRNEVPPFASPGAQIHIDSQLQLPAEKDLPPNGVTDIWVVVHDERAGESWAHGTVIITP